MIMQVITRHCDTCGAVIYIEVNLDDQHGIPSGEPDKHAKWHERNGS